MNAELSDIIYRLKGGKRSKKKKSVFHKLSKKNSLFRRGILSTNGISLHIPPQLMKKHVRYGKFHSFGLLPPEGNLSYRAPVWKSAACYVMKSEKFSLRGRITQIKEGKPLVPFVKTGDDLDWDHSCEFFFDEDASTFLHARYGITQLRT